MTIEEYVTSLGGASTLVTKVTKLSEYAKSLCPEEIADFFLSEYKTSDKGRVFETFWFFSPNFVMESKRVQLESFNIDIMCIDKYIDTYELDFSGFEPGMATEDSSLSLTAKLGVSVLVFKASGTNCDKLWELFEKYIKPNLYTCK